MASIVAEVGIDGKKFDSGLKSILGGLGQMKGGFGALSIGIGAAGLAFGAITTQMQRALDTTTTYAGEVRQLSSITNQSAEETSRMIQVMDDFALTSQQAGQAARFLAKEGLSLNIETLEKLSDEYKALNTGQERSTFLMKNFGKAGQDFALIMEQGSDTIKRNSEQVKKGLILTQEQIDKTEELRIAQDNLNDAKEEWLVLTGTRLVPVLTNVIDGLNLLSTGTLDAEKRTRLLAERTGIDLVTGLSEADIIAQKFKTTLSGLPTPIEDTTDSLLDFADAVGSGADSTKQWLLTSYQASLAMRNIPAEEAARKMLDYEYALGLVSKAEYDAKRKAIDLKGAIDSLQSKDITVTTYMVTQMGQAGDPIQQAQAYAATQTSAQTGPGSGWVYKGGNGYGKGPDGKVRHYYNAATGAYRASGGQLDSGWTMVGEQGFELIDPSGMVHSNPDSKKLIKAGVTPFKKLLTGGELGGDPYHWPKPSGGYNFSDDAAMMGMPGIPQNWIDNYNSNTGGGGGGSSAVIQTAAAASQSASQAAQQTSRAVDVTAQMSTQMASSSAAQMASLASIDRRLANLPSQLRDVFQQVIQQ